MWALRRRQQRLAAGSPWWAWAAARPARRKVACWRPCHLKEDHPLPGPPCAAPPCQLTLAGSSMASGPPPHPPRSESHLLASDEPSPHNLSTYCNDARAAWKCLGSLLLLDVKTELCCNGVRPCILDHAAGAHAWDGLSHGARVCLQASNLAPRTPATGGPSIASMATPVSSSSSDLSSAGRTSSGKKAAKQRKGGLSMFLAGMPGHELTVGLGPCDVVAYTCREAGCMGLRRVTEPEHGCLDVPR